MYKKTILMQHELESLRNYSEFICDDRDLERLKASFDTIRDVLGGFGVTLPTLEEVERIYVLLRAIGVQSPAASDGSEPRALSERQCECMYWIAKGKSSWETAQIMEISESTVNYHIKQALRYFDTNSRTVAAIRCVTAGYFDID